MIDIIFDISNVLANVAVIGGVIIALLQLNGIQKSNKLQYLGMKVDHDRRKKQATIEFYNEMRKECSGFIEAFQENRLADVVAIEKGEENTELRKNVRRYLSFMDRFSIGINTDIYDFVIFQRLYGDTTIQMFNFVKSYADHLKKYTSFTHYNDFKTLVQKLEESQKERLEDPLAKSGNIPKL